MGTKLGKDAYNYKNDTKHFIGRGAYSNVFRGSRKSDKLKVAINNLKTNWSSYHLLKNRDYMKRSQTAKPSIILLLQKF